MTCADLTNDRLSEPFSADARAHLERCEACRRRGAEIAGLSRSLEALGRALPEERNPGLANRILDTLPPRRRYAVRRPSPWPWVAAAAAVVLVVFAATARPRPTPSAPPAFVVRPQAPEPGPASPVEEAPPAPPPRPEPVPGRPPAPTPPPPPSPAVPVPAAPRPAVVPGPPPSPEPVVPPPAPTIPEAPERLLLAALEGEIEMEADGTWRKAAEGVPWTGPLRASKAARFSLPEGIRIAVARGTVLRPLSAEPPEFAVDKGAVLAEVPPGRGLALAVATPDARVRVTGTRFGVKRGDVTEVVVTSGEVVVANEKGQTAVPAGAGLQVRKGTAPGRPKAVDAEAMTAWSRELDPPERVRFRSDFENGRAPDGWDSVKVVPGPSRGLNRGCLEAAPGAGADLRRLDRGAPAAATALELRFRYWSEDGSPVTALLFCERLRDNVRYELKAVGRGRWEQVRLPVSEFFRLSDGARPQAGDRFSWITLTAASGRIYFDDIELVEILR